LSDFTINEILDIGRSFKPSTPLAYQTSLVGQELIVLQKLSSCGYIFLTNLKGSNREEL
jgi:hypothetical protein